MPRSFLTLPLELRFEIYSYCPAFTLLQLFGTSSQIREELKSRPTLIEESYGHWTERLRDNKGFRFQQDECGQAVWTNLSKRGRRNGPLVEWHMIPRGPFSIMDIWYLQRQEAALFIDRYSPFLQGDFVRSYKNRTPARLYRPAEDRISETEEGSGASSISEASEYTSPSPISETAEDNSTLLNSEAAEDTSPSQMCKTTGDSRTSSLYKRFSKSFQKLLPRGLSASISAKSLQRLQPRCLIASFKVLSKSTPPPPVPLTAIIPSDTSLVFPLDVEPRQEIYTSYEDSWEDGSIDIGDEDDPRIRSPYTPLAAPPTGLPSTSSSEPEQPTPLNRNIPIITSFFNTHHRFAPSLFLPITLITNDITVYPEDPCKSELAIRSI
ncbi:hypothetical protein BJ508DRAFT_329367 [Ascobolus immersus RN42]|uniref:F-box domain-containing protein n=1 Tax=Ascobolus immersus RN42 TaxID=1160509 RepID=A0A3N4I0K1_ASCIM|nr:hypothetical protein BJ508DRAFT_329367 [Ascobolus immersus RN42]